MLNRSVVETGTCLKALVACVLLAVATASSAAAAANSFKPLDWSDLEPAVTETSDPFADLPDDQYDALILLLRYRTFQTASSPLMRPAVKRREALLKKFKDQGVDLEVQIRKYDAILEERRKTAEAGVAELDSRNISITGYVLPINADGNLAQEFLLVPSPRSCSHSRMPLPNQTILVQPPEPYAFSHYFEQVTVRGTIQLKVQKRSIYLIDGKITLASAYAMDDAKTVQGQAASPAQ